jgi:AcrR family transcriptional regulator
MNKADNTRRHIIEKAAPLFNIKGIAATSVLDVTKAARVTRGCLYGHFENKDELAYACVDYLLQTASEERDAALSKQSAAFGKIMAYLAINKDPLKPLVAGGCPIMNLSTEVDDTNPAIKRKVRLNIDQHIKAFTEILKEGIKNGEFTEKLDAEDFAVRMLCGVKGALVLGNIKNSAVMMKTVTKNIQTELESYRVIMNGASTTGLN